MKRPEYRGDFSYNAKKSGQFHIVNAKYEVEAVHPNYQDDEEKSHPWAVTDEGRIIKAGVFKPLVDPKLFDAAQERLAGFSIKGSRRPREDGYPLSRILICDHCGKPLYGCTARDIVYTDARPTPSAGWAVAVATKSARADTSRLCCGCWARKSNGWARGLKRLSALSNRNRHKTAKPT